MIAYAIINDQGYWCGIWSDRATAEAVLARGKPADKERIVELVERKRLPVTKLPPRLHPSNTSEELP